MAIKLSNTETNDLPKTLGYINVKVRLADGKLYSLGKYGLALQEGRTLDEAIAQKLADDPEFIVSIQNNLEINYVPVSNRNDEDLESLLDF